MAGVKDAPTPAVAALARAGVEHRIHRYDHDPAAASFGLEAATAFGVDPARVFKTLVTSVDGRLVIAVVPVDAEVDMRQLAAVQCGKQAEMADPSLAERATGHVRGGISPLGQKRPLPTVIDSGVLAWDTVFVSGGRRGLEVELSPDALVTATGARVVAPIARKA